MPALRSLKTQTSYTSVRSTPPTPNIATTRDASPASTPPSSLLSSSILSSSLIAAARKSTPLSGGFAPYEADEDEIIAPHERVAGVSTPEPIKVTKVKKKKVKVCVALVVNGSAIPDGLISPRAPSQSLA